MYRFDWTLPGHPTFGQAVHGAEIAFVFDNLELLDKLGLEIQPSMQKLAQDMQQAWVAFARDGKPVLSEGLEVDVRQRRADYSYFPSEY